MTHGKEKHSARWLLERWGGDERQRDVMKSDPLRDHRILRSAGHQQAESVSQHLIKAPILASE